MQTNHCKHKKHEYGGGWGRNISEKRNKVYKDITMIKEQNRCAKWKKMILRMWREGPGDLQSCFAKCSNYHQALLEMTSLHEQTCKNTFAIEQINWCGSLGEQMFIRLGNPRRSMGEMAPQALHSKGLEPLVSLDSINYTVL